MIEYFEILILCVSLFLPFVYFKQDTEVLERHIKRGNIQVTKNTYYFGTILLMFITIGLYKTEVIQDIRLLKLAILPAFSMLTFFLSLISVCTFMEDTMNRLLNKISEIFK